MNHKEWFHNRSNSLPKLLLTIEKYSRAELEEQYATSLLTVNRMLENYDAYKRDDSSDMTIIFNLAVIGKIVHQLNKESEGER